MYFLSAKLLPKEVDQSAAEEEGALPSVLGEH